MIRIVNILVFIPKLLLDLLFVWPLRWITWIFRGNSDKRPVDRKLWQALKNASSYREWEEAAEALNASDPGLLAWKAEPRGEYRWDTILERTAQLDEADREWRTRESRNSTAYRDLLMPVQSRDVGNITKPELHEHLWTGTKTAIEDYIAATVRGVRTVRRSEASGASVDEKNEWFKARRMVLGRTALFLQGGEGLGWGHLGVMKGLFENKLLPDVIVGTRGGALMAALVCVCPDSELKDLFDGEGDHISLGAFAARPTAHSNGHRVGWKALAGRLRRWLRTGKVLDPEKTEQCVLDNIGDMTFERAWQISGRHLCITLASDAPGTPNMLSWKTAPNVLIRTAALASSEMHPDKCLDMILERNSRGEVRPWLLNDETPAYRDKRRRKRWPSQKPPVWRVQELWHINHYIISMQSAGIGLLGGGTHFWSIHRRHTPNYLPLLTLALGTTLLAIPPKVLLYLLRHCFRRHVPVGVGLNPTAEEKTITPQRRCKPIAIVSDTGWPNLSALWQDPTHADIRASMRLGEHAVWPMIPRLHVRMDVEVELHKKYKGDPEDRPRRTLADLCERLRERKEEDEEAPQALL